MTPEELVYIRSRHDCSARAVAKCGTPWRSGAHRDAHNDRGALLAEVELIQREVAAAREDTAFLRRSLMSIVETYGDGIVPHTNHGVLLSQVASIAKRAKPSAISQARCHEMSYEHGQERCMRGAGHRTKCAFASDVGEDVDLAAMHAEDAAERSKS